MRAAPDDDYRVVLDEESLRWHELNAAELGYVLTAFADLLEPFADGRHVAYMTVAWEVECWQSITFADLPYTPDLRIPRDARVRLARLLDKCRAVDPREDDLPRLVRIDGGEPREPSWGMSHALARAATGKAMSCMVLATDRQPSGWVMVDRDSHRIAMHILREPGAVTGFWRGIFTRELTTEQGFFDLAAAAFPGLLFAPSLQFNRFRGSYGEVLPWLVSLLGAVSDHFVDALENHRGDRNQIIAYFSAMGLDISPESPNTKKNKQAWKQRMVEFESHEYRCEWHGKRMWDRDRVHFSLPIAKYDGKILVGEFVDHMDT